jgi:hypothetical protein
LKFFQNKFPVTEIKERWGALMKYQVKIVEKLAMTVIVEGSSAKEALEQVEEKYWNEEIIVESDKGPDVTFQAFLVGGKCQGKI